MEQLDSHIPNQDRTLEQLCHNITHSAQNAYLKISNKERIALVITAVLLLGILALAWYFQWFEIDWYQGSMMLATLVVWFVVIYLVSKLLINRMKRSTSPKQLLHTATRLKWWVKFSRALTALIILADSIKLLIDDNQHVTALVLAGLVFVIVLIATPMDSDFGEGLEQLKYRLND